MPQHLVYDLRHGYIHDWLVLGPAILPVDTSSETGGEAGFDRPSPPSAAEAQANDFPQPPQELEKIERFGPPLYWEVAHCQDDHLLGWEATPAIVSRVCAWAFVRLACPAPTAATLQLIVSCRAAAWLNGRLLVPYEQHEQESGQTAAHIPIALQPGDNDLLIRLERLAAGPTALMLGARLDLSSQAVVRVKVPTITDRPEQRQEWEQALAHAHLDQPVYQREQMVTVVCDDEMPGVRGGAVRLQQPDGITFVRMDVTFKAGARLEGLLAAQLAPGRLQAVLTPPLEDYYTRGFRARRILPFVANTGFIINEPATAWDDRLIALVREAARGPDRLYAGIAKMALGWWAALDTRDIRGAIARVRRGEYDCLSDLLGLTAMRLRMAGRAQFPVELLAEVDACLRSFDYTCRSVPAIDLSRESNQITLYAAQTLAGQALGRKTMAASGLTARQERLRGEALAEAWLRRRGQTGLAAWNSHLDCTVAALACLADLAQNRNVRDLATVLLDKLLFGLAVNSFAGAYAAPRAEARAAWLRSAALAPEAPLNYLLWGMGGLNTHVRGAVSLGLAGARYQVPELIRKIALDRWPDMLSRERQQTADDAYVNTVVFKTPDFMLASAQDYRAGQRGRREHIWQATLGYDALVFANHPASFSDGDAVEAGWWCGNGSLPRVVQHRDALIALYSVPEDDPLGFTHAFFPTYAFDEHVIEAGWAFARCGDGYLALTATPAMTLLRAGPDAGRELRAVGPRSAWLCQMGRAALDGSFDDFRQAVLARSVRVNGLQVAWDTIRGEHLAFDWSGPLLVDGAVEPLTDFKHVENPYALAAFPAQSMDIGYGEDMLRLHFA